MKIGEIVNNHDKAVKKRCGNQYTYWNKHFNNVRYKVFRKKSRGHSYQIGTVFYKAVIGIKLGIELN